MAWVRPTLDRAMNAQTADFHKAALTQCDREPIHIPGSIQPHGALIALDPHDLRIVCAGGDTVGLLGEQPDLLLNETGSRLFSISQAQRLRDLLNTGRQISRPMLAFRIESRAERAIDVIAHRSSGLLVLEFEPQREQGPDNPLALVQAMIRRVQQAETAQTVCEAVVAEIRAVIGFDRVMAYQFLADGSGAVKAESLNPGADSFLGLHYPESDIPKQARELYRTNWIRMIPNACYLPAPIIPSVNPKDGRPLDLSQSVIRSVSAVHRQYLTNMGVVASMSLSLISRGQLWGLIACHHGAPRYLPYPLREACELFAEMASSQLEMKVAAEHFEAQLLSTRIHEELLTRMSQESELAEGLIRFRPNLLDFIPAAGVGLWIDGQFTGLGATPHAEEVEALVAWLNETVKEGVFCTDCLPLLYPLAESFADKASGLLALSVSKTPCDYVLWFRPEVVRTVNWAGNPNKPAIHDGEVLTPRKSFAAWQESVRLHAPPWLKIEVEAAHRLRLSLLEVVLRRIDQIARERETAHQQQERLTKQLDSRLQEWQKLARELEQETELRAIVEAELSQVLHRTVADQEAERLRIARELHDTLGQSLTLLRLGLERIRESSPDSAELQQRVVGVNQIAADLVRQVNRLAWEIRPTALDDLGIQTAVQTLLDNWSESSKIRFDLHLALGEQRLPLAIETTLYRVLQETLTNVVRHAEATEVAVILTAAEQLVTMVVEDDGRGFDWNDAVTRTPLTRRLGLLGIRERLATVGGTLEIESSRGNGTSIFVRIPIQ
jgi:chemotaxis family two-component system sensor kinase Cph1